MNEIKHIPPNPVLIILRLWLDSILDTIDELPVENRESVTDKMLLTISPYLSNEYRYKPKMPRFLEK